VSVPYGAFSARWRWLLSVGGIFRAPVVGLKRVELTRGGASSLPQPSTRSAGTQLE